MWPTLMPGTVTPVAAPTSSSPVLETLMAAAVDATAASRGWLLALVGDELRVVAAHGENAPQWVGRQGPVGGWAGSVVANGRPVALSPEGNDPRFGGDLLVGGGPRPSSLMCFPCPSGGRVVGALLLVDKAAGAPFSLDDVELVTRLADIAGADIAETAGDIAAVVPGPDELGRGLAQLAGMDASRYATLANVVSQLLHGE